jgi:nucleotide-binding universal stress UspA family protein
MYKKIVVPLDGSAAAECSLEHARGVAAKGTRIVLVRVLSKPHYDYMLRDAELSACLDEELCKEEALYLDRIAPRVKKPGVTVSTCVIAEQGPIAEVIGRFVRKAGADLIVVSAHGKTGLIGRLLGSMPDRLVHHAGVPVLFVHP